MISRFCCIFKRKCGKIGKKTTSFDFILSTAVEGCSYAEGALFRGNAERFKRHPSASTGLRWSSLYTIFFWCRPREQLSRTVSHKP